jgi:hypothetical protein
VVETCSEAFGIADAALGLGHEVRVVPGTLDCGQRGACFCDVPVADARTPDEDHCAGDGRRHVVFAFECHDVLLEAGRLGVWLRNQLIRRKQYQGHRDSERCQGRGRPDCFRMNAGLLTMSCPASSSTSNPDTSNGASRLVSRRYGAEPARPHARSAVAAEQDDRGQYGNELDKDTRMATTNTIYNVARPSRVVLPLFHRRMRLRAVGSSARAAAISRTTTEQYPRPSGRRL